MREVRGGPLDTVEGWREEARLWRERASALESVVVRFLVVTPDDFTQCVGDGLRALQENCGPENAGVSIAIARLINGDATADDLAVIDEARARVGVTKQ